MNEEKLHKEVANERLEVQLGKQVKKYNEIQNLMRFFTKDGLRNIHISLNGNKAVGIDGVSKLDFEENLEENLDNLVLALKDKTYRPKTLRRVKIPKPNGKVRCLGIPSYQDKIVQGLMALILTIIYEPKFSDVSYGYRPNRDCHTALKKFNEHIKTKNITYLLDADIKGFFDNVNHTKLLEILKLTIKDKWLIFYIRRFLKCGVLEEGIFIKTVAGTPQGGIISPVLANIYLDKVLDQWFEIEMKHKYSNSELIRYCDDFIVMFNSLKDAIQFKEELERRFKEFDLQLSEEKTKIVPFNSKNTLSDHINFLGFDISVNDENDVIFKTSLGKFIKQQESIDNIFKDNSTNLEDKILNLKSTLKGLYSYYGVSSNVDLINNIYNYAVDKLYLYINQNQHNVFNFITQIIPNSRLANTAIAGNLVDEEVSTEVVSNISDVSVASGLSAFSDKLVLTDRSADIATSKYVDKPNITNIPEYTVNYANNSCSFTAAVTQLSISSVVKPTDTVVISNNRP